MKAKDKVYSVLYSLNKNSLLDVEHKKRQSFFFFLI